MKNILHPSNTKSGVASLYVVIFATILFGVITLSFVRIILSESTQTNNDDLSQSAYDSALAGVEDAKVAIDKYYQCLSNPSRSGCTDAIRNYSALFDTDTDGGCSNGFKLKSYLGYDADSENEVRLQESTTNGLEQAYTCVIIKDTVADYRATLTSSNRNKVIPLAIKNSNNAGTDIPIQNVKTIEFSWYSDVNGNNLKLSSNGKLANKANATVPPTVSLTLITTKDQINLQNYDTAQTGIDQTTVILVPTQESSDGAVDSIGYNVLQSNGNAYKANGSGTISTPNNTFQIKCSQANEFACTAKLTNLSFADISNALLVADLPYGDEKTDFKVTMQDGNGNTAKFKGSQISIDATGRANNLLRRVETRLDPADLFFPYPQYALDLGDAENALVKNFWITNNCWTNSGTCPNNGTL